MGHRIHYYGYLSWILVRVSKATEVHCGYIFPWSPFGLFKPFVDASFHDYHHLYNVGNYGAFTNIWDSMFGTNTSYEKY